MKDCSCILVKPFLSHAFHPICFKKKPPLPLTHPFQHTPSTTSLDNPTSTPPFNTSLQQPPSTTPFNNLPQGTSLNNHPPLPASSLALPFLNWWEPVLVPLVSLIRKMENTSKPFKTLLEGFTGETHNVEFWTDSSWLRSVCPERLGSGR